MKWVTRGEMRAIDRRAIEEFGIPALVLMENAGRGAAREAMSLYRERGLNGPALVFCGAGNNGGDGFVIARHLANAGYEVRVFCCFDRAQADRSSEAGVNLAICERMGLPLLDICTIEDAQQARGHLRDGVLVVDALFGIGLAQPPREPHATLIRLLNETGQATLAVDVPSGLDADTGRPLGLAVRADLTATMACPKLGFRNASPYVGRLALVDIGLPAELAL